MDTVYDAKLLIVDDNAELLALLCEQLRGAGYGHIRTAQSCAAARACRMGTGFRCSGRCGQKRTFRRCFSPHGMRMPTVCSGWVLAQMTT